ncbi:MAG: hypothetical protein NWP87_04490 [Winogradskyella sp.]|nr:hypothetical protein [Winogradskyella sp.]
MTTFEDLKSQWENQPQEKTPNKGSELIVKKMTHIKRGQRITNVVLLLTIGVLIAFFFYIQAYSIGLLSLGLFLMISSLGVRVYIEYVSLKQLKQVKVTTNSNVFKTNMIAYYKKRLRTHYVSTPIILILYSIGFIILLPFFKESLSSFFYNNFVFYGIVILIVMIFYIRNEIKKELSILKDLSQ